MLYVKSVYFYVTVSAANLVYVNIITKFYEGYLRFIQNDNITRGYVIKL